MMNPNQPANFNQLQPPEILIFADVAIAERAKGAVVPSQDVPLNDQVHKLFGGLDGMGGQGQGNDGRGGEKAAQILWGSFGDFITRHRKEFTPQTGGQLMYDMFVQSQDALRQGELQYPQYKGMGAVAAVSHLFDYDGKAYAAIGIAGDAVYARFDKYGNRVEKSEEECRQPPHANQVWNSITGHNAIQQRQFFVTEIHDGDRLFFLSDGITGDQPQDKLQDSELQTAAERILPQQAADYLLNVSLGRKEDDKLAVVVDVNLIETQAPAETTMVAPLGGAALHKSGVFSVPTRPKPGSLSPTPTSSPAPVAFVSASSQPLPPSSPAMAPQPAPANSWDAMFNALNNQGNQAAQPAAVPLFPGNSAAQPPAPYTAPVVPLAPVPQPLYTPVSPPSPMQPANLNPTWTPVPPPFSPTPVGGFQAPQSQNSYNQPAWSPQPGMGGNQYNQAWGGTPMYAPSPVQGSQGFDLGAPEEPPATTTRVYQTRGQQAKEAAQDRIDDLSYEQRRRYNERARNLAEKSGDKIEHGWVMRFRRTR